jgi:hypothetical protein
MRWEDQIRDSFFHGLQRLGARCRRFHLDVAEKFVEPARHGAARVGLRVDEQDSHACSIAAQVAIRRIGVSVDRRAVAKGRRGATLLEP